LVSCVRTTEIGEECNDHRRREGQCGDPRIAEPPEVRRALGLVGAR
jgi:hypothetical protein